MTDRIVEIVGELVALVEGRANEMSGDDLWEVFDEMLRAQRWVADSPEARATFARVVAARKRLFGLRRAK